MQRRWKRRRASRSGLGRRSGGHGCVKVSRLQTSRDRWRDEFAGKRSIEGSLSMDHCGNLLLLPTQRVSIRIDLREIGGIEGHSQL